MSERTLVSFDWALKHLLRDKANFGVLEGVLSALLDDRITVNSVLDSESSRESETAKYNRVICWWKMGRVSYASSSNTSTNTTISLACSSAPRAVSSTISGWEKITARCAK